MISKKNPQKNQKENYLDKIPIIASNLNFTVDDKGCVTILIENKGIMNKILQKLIKKPKISYIHLDEMGNFIWPYMDGKRSIFEIGEKVKEHFGDKAEPLYERLSAYIKTLEDYGFID